jgi:hypothetical protein
MCRTPPEVFDGGGGQEAGNGAWPRATVAVPGFYSVRVDVAAARKTNGLAAITLSLAHW